MDLFILHQSFSIRLHRFYPFLRDYSPCSVIAENQHPRIETGTYVVAPALLNFSLQVYNMYIQCNVSMDGYISVEILIPSP